MVGEYRNASTKAITRSAMRCCASSFHGMPSVTTALHSAPMLSHVLRSTSIRYISTSSSLSKPRPCRMRICFRMVDLDIEHSILCGERGRASSR